MPLDNAMRNAIADFIKAAIDAAKPAERPVITALGSMLTTLVGAPSEQSVSAAPSRAVYSVTVEHRGTAHYEGMAALADALGIKESTASVSLSKAKGTWGTTRVDSAGNGVHVLVRRGMWGEHSADVADFLDTAAKRGPGRPVKNAAATLPKSNVAQTIKRVKALPPGANKLKAIRSVHDDEDSYDSDAPTTPETPRLDYTGKHGEDFYVEGQRTTKASYDDAIRERARKAAGLA